jgi:glycerol-3-phosphate acyltransferase PlsY
MILLATLIAVVAAYAIGSLSFALVVRRLTGLFDGHAEASHSATAIRQRRIVTALTLALDAIKGYVPVALVVVLGHRFGLDESAVALVAIAVFVGHLWPAYFGFSGGKCVATAAGAVFAINPGLGLATLATWIVVAVFSRYATLAAVVAAALAPFYQFLIWEPSVTAFAVAVISLLLIWRHGASIRRLMAGNESKFGQRDAAKRADAAPGKAPHPRAPRARASSSHPAKKGHS